MTEPNPQDIEPVGEEEKVGPHVEPPEKEVEVDENQQTIDAAVTKYTGDQAAQAERRSKIPGIISIIKGGQIEEAITKFCGECIGITQEEAKKRVESVKSFIGGLKIHGKEVTVSEEEISIIQEMMCEPILNGHISGETALGMITDVTVMSGETLKKLSLEQNGYEGIMFCDPTTGQIIIAKEALTGEYKAEDGSELDIRHMIIHEMSHVATEDVFFNKDPQNEQEKEAVTEAQKFSSEIIRLAEHSKAERIPQSRHIETVLDMLSNLPQEFQKTGKPKEEYEAFKQQRESLAAKEILTDYTAIYFKSLKSQEQEETDRRSAFIRECLFAVDNKRLSEYVGSAASEPGVDSKTRIAETLRAKTPEEKAEVAEKYPEFNKACEMYNRFFNLAEKHLSDDKIKAAALTRLESGDGLEHDGYYDPGVPQSRSGAESPQTNEERIGTAVAGAIESFADEVNFTKPIE